jgi:hypothetical protein
MRSSFIYLTSRIKPYTKKSETLIEMKRLIAYVSGRVQKVGYRSRIVGMAKAFGLKGWVENLADGRVKIHCQKAMMKS